MENKRSKEIYAEIGPKKPESILERVREAEGTYTTNHGFINGYSFSNQFIGNVITQSHVDEWSFQTPIYLVAPTGTGKSCLVLEKVLTSVKAHGKRLCIIASRTVLILQYKKQVAEIEEPNLLNALTDDGFRERYSIGDVDIFSYQELVHLLQADPVAFFQEYGTVVLDECHFFIQDASFNELTQETLERILTGSQHCLRIYLTATPDICLDELIEMEQKFYKNLQLNMGGMGYGYLNNNTQNYMLYYFGINYDNITPCFFKDDEEIVSVITADLSSAKYLICVDSRERGYELEKSLAKGSAEFIDAELKNKDKAEVVSAMVNKEKFDKKVLIATSFLDVGINLKDEKLVNIVIYSTDRTHFIQSIGRKRRQAQQNVHLYINVPSQEKVSKYLKRACHKKVELIEDSKRCCESNTSYIVDLPDSIYVKVVKGKSEVRFNGFSFSYWKHRIIDLEDMLEGLNIIPNSDEAFARYYLRWLDLEHMYEQAHWLGRTPEAANDELIQLIGGFANKDLTEGEFEQFKREFRELYNNLYLQTKIRNDRPPHLTVLNQKFNELGMPYIVSNAGRGKYIIKKG